MPIDGLRAIFHRIEPGKFKMGPVGAARDVSITKAFNMMATVTTQKLYRNIAELANYRFGPKYNIDVDPSFHKGETRPVKRVSYDEVKIWISGLNDLSKIDEVTLYDLIPGHKKSNVYRLPTEAEWEFVIRGRGEYNTRYHFGNDQSLFSKYVSFSNLEHGTYPVALKRPLLVDGKKFYDFGGNVSEWTGDLYNWDVYPRAGIDPVGPPDLAHNNGKDIRVVRGGGVYSGRNDDLSSGGHDYLDPDKRSDHLGFRLVSVVE